MNWVVTISSIICSGIVVWMAVDLSRRVRSLEDSRENHHIRLNLLLDVAKDLNTLSKMRDRSSHPIGDAQTVLNKQEK